MVLILAYLTLSVIVAGVASGRRKNFWFYLFISILLTPVAGILTLIFSKPSKGHPAADVPLDYFDIDQKE